MSRRVVAFLGVICLAGASLAIAQAAPTTSGSGRNVTSRIAPAYPELVKKMHLQGTGKVEAEVWANGAVKSTRVQGGNPVLLNAATDAVNKWRLEPGAGETTEVIELTFIPQCGKPNLPHRPEAEKSHP